MKSRTRPNLAPLAAYAMAHDPTAPRWLALFVHLSAYAFQGILISLSILTLLALWLP